MKRKTRFDDGGSVTPGDGVQYFDEDALAQARGRNLRAEIEAMQPEGRISESFYDEGTGRELTTRRNLETGEYYSTEPITRKAEARVMPKAPPIREVAGSGRGSMPGRTAADAIMRDAGGGGRGRSMGRTAADEITYTPGRATGRAEIPVEAGARGPEKRTSAAMEMGDTERVLRTTLGAAAPGAVRAAPAVGRGIGSLMTAAKEGYREGEKLKEVARAAERGAESRKAIQAARTARQKSEAEAMERAKPILQSRKDTKASRAARTRRTEEDTGIEFSKGGSTASRRADGCAVRGKTRGKIY